MGMFLLIGDVLINNPSKGLLLKPSQSVLATCCSALGKVVLPGVSDRLLLLERFYAY